MNHFLSHVQTLKFMNRKTVNSISSIKWQAPTLLTDLNYYTNFYQCGRYFKCSGNNSFTIISLNKVLYETCYNPLNFNLFMRINSLPVVLLIVTNISLIIWKVLLFHAKFISVKFNDAKQLSHKNLIFKSDKNFSSLKNKTVIFF